MPGMMSLKVSFFLSNGIQGRIAGKGGLYYSFKKNHRQILRYELYFLYTYAPYRCTMQYIV